jgi:hypothetical protein
MLGTDRIEVDPLEFVAKVLIHVPDKNSRRVIGYGVYSNRALGERKKARCGGEMNVVAVITDPTVIDRILRHIEKKERAPPEGEAAA